MRRLYSEQARISREQSTHPLKQPGTVSGLRAGHSPETASCAREKRPEYGNQAIVRFLPKPVWLKSRNLSSAIYITIRHIQSNILGSEKFSANSIP